MSRAQRIAQFAAVVGLIASLGAATVILVRQQHAISAARSVSQKLVAEQVGQCHRDHSLRKQYRVRGENQDDILRYSITLVSRAKQVGNLPPSVAAAAIAKFRRDRARIKILPIPSCQALRVRLSNAFGGAFS